MKSIPQLTQDITTLFKEIKALKTRINQFSSGGRVSATAVITPGAWYRLEGWVCALPLAVQNPTLGTLPINAVVTNVDVWCEEGFDSDGTDLLTVGYDADNDAYVTALDVSAPGVLAPAMGTSVGKVDAVSRSVEAYYVNGGSEPTVGKAHVIVQYIIATAEP